jgi:hypothetical protein
MRSPSTVAEDRNKVALYDNTVTPDLAVAVRGDRGSQLRHRVDVIELDPDWRPLSAAAEDRNHPAMQNSQFPAVGWRPLFAAVEGRNPASIS